MLARAAERVYWTGRYLERAENTARIVQQYSLLLLDLPDAAGVSWQDLVPVFNFEKQLSSAGGEIDESLFLKFLLADRSNSSSLLSSLYMARENIRNTRDLLPMESWESVNELYQFARDHLKTAAASEDKFEVLAQCINRCQQVSGCLHNTMSHRSPYQFLILGQSIERADMTSRIIDIAASYFQKQDDLIIHYGSTLWSHILKTVGGFQMYRQYVQPRVSGTRVIEFLLHDDTFPRAMSCSIAEGLASAGRLPRNDKILSRFAILRGELAEGDADDLNAVGVSELMDVLQGHLDQVHRAVTSTWFLVSDA